MQSAFSAVRKYLSYLFILFALIWVGIAFLAGSVFVLWPAVACGVGGVLLKAMPGSRLTVAWAPAASLLGLILSAYQVYEAIPLLSGAFATVASASAALFFLLGVGHVYLAYASYSAGSAR